MRDPAATPEQMQFMCGSALLHKNHGRSAWIYAAESCKNQATFCRNRIFLREPLLPILQVRKGVSRVFFPIRVCCRQGTSFFFPMFHPRESERILKMRMPIKAVTDILMVIMFLLLMADRHTGNVFHEWLGVTVTGAFLLHTWLNRNWYKTLAEGHYSVSRIARLVLNMLLLLAVMGTLTSAVFISRTVFPSLEFRGELFSRAVHVCCAHWCFLLAAAHLGIYGKRLGAAPGRHVHASHSCWRDCILPVLCAVPAAYGAYVFLSRDLVYPLTMNGAFMLWNENERVIFLILDYGALFFLCAWAAHALSRPSREGKGRTRLLIRAWRERGSFPHESGMGMRLPRGNGNGVFHRR